LTDIFPDGIHIAGRLGVTATYTDGEFIVSLHPRPEVMRHGVARISVLSFLVDAVAGIVIDDDMDQWALTSDMTVRMRPHPAPERIDAIGMPLRRGRRSATSTVELTSGGGEPVAVGAIGFVKIPRRPTDPPKPDVSPADAAALFGGAASLARPLREEAGIEVVDPSTGEVRMEVTPKVRNPAGTLQGAMVALLAEAAVEDFMSSRFDQPLIVTDLDLRYLAQAHVGPLHTRCRLLGTGPEAPVQVELVDSSVERVTTLVSARASRIP
jgi:acyl-coenzyme A thioesterase PaaI-like protein